MTTTSESAARALARFGLDDFVHTVRTTRTYRRFDEGDPIPADLLEGLVDLARLTVSGANRQPLRYRVIVDAATRAQVFDTLKWAGALPDWDGPERGERPTGYIVICDAGGGATLRVDEGIAAQTIMLAARQAGFGGCFLHAFDAVRLTDALALDEAGVRPLMVVALGRPVEDVRIEPLDAAPAGTDYWRDAEGAHHVPKRSLEEVLV